jgi:hypothetical protein
VPTTPGASCRVIDGRGHCPCATGARASHTKEPAWSPAPCPSRIAAARAACRQCATRAKLRPPAARCTTEAARCARDRGATEPRAVRVRGLRGWGPPRGPRARPVPGAAGGVESDERRGAAAPGTGPARRAAIGGTPNHGDRRCSTLSTSSSTSSARCALFANVCSGVRPILPTSCGAPPAAWPSTSVRLRQDKPGRRKHELRSQAKALNGTHRVTNPGEREATARKRVLRGVGATRPAKRGQRACGPCDPAPKERDGRPTWSSERKAVNGSLKTS